MGRQSSFDYDLRQCPIDVVKRSMELDQNNGNAMETREGKIPWGKDPEYPHCLPATLA
jgi:hypothetical protein